MIYAAESKFDQKNRIHIPTSVFKAAGLKENEECRFEYDSTEQRLSLYQGEKPLRINAQYTIIKAIKIVNVEFVLGKFSEVDFVTWEYSETGGYYWGHYFGDEEAALIDLYRRAAAECAMRADMIEDQSEGRKAKCSK